MGNRIWQKNWTEEVRKLLQGDQKCELKQYHEGWRRMGSKENVRN